MVALVVLSGAECIATEDDGLTWSVVSALPVSISGANARGAGSGTSYYVSDGVSAVSSVDAVEWVVSTNHPLSSGSRILFNGSIFIAVDSSTSQVSRSTDGGATWSAPAALPVTPTVAGVIGSTFCLMQNNTGDRATSSDGVTWGTGAGGAIVFAGHTTTSFSADRVIHAGAPGEALGCAFTTNGTAWTNGGVIGMLGDLSFSGVACSSDGANAVVSSQSGKGTFRSSDGGVTWAAKVDTTNFQSAGAMWTGTAQTFVIPISSGGICERSADGGATWGVIPNPGALSIAVHQTATFVLPAGLPVPAGVFWTNFTRTQEVI